jgi:hypothetical protein
VNFVEQNCHFPILSRNLCGIPLEIKISIF